MRRRGSLAEYKNLRNFTRTPEPHGKGGKTQGASALRFVIHEHHASHLHWDLRLEMAGVLKSWAVPKEPPTTTGVKRLAIQTEDHPLDYIDFEGIIPEGNYGAGVVKVWDTGPFELVNKSEEEIKFILKGERLKGTYYLIHMPHMGEDKWLFFKGSPPKVA